MTTSLELDHDSRLLVLVPHPDDETLATGGLIQMALAAGAQLRVIMATDGDNNPWPQRWIEKRWRIDASARARWGARRRSEASRALAALGVPQQDVRHLGWPDQGITASLMRDSATTDLLVAEILDFSPNVIVAPSCLDLHPDHNAMGVMVELALAESNLSGCRRFGYVVHGNLSQENLVALPADRERSSVKLHALRMHASQMILSEKRMTRLGQRPEQFEAIEVRSGHDIEFPALEWRMPLPSAVLALQRHSLYLIAETQGPPFRASIALPWRLSAAKLATAIGQDNVFNATVLAEAGELKVVLSGTHPVRRVFAKIERLGARVLIYDGHGWTVVGDPPRRN